MAHFHKFGSVHKRMCQLNSTCRADHYAGTAVITFSRIHNDRIFPLLAAEKLRRQLTIFSNLYETQSEPQHNIGHMHRLIFEAYKAGDIDKAGELMKKHLDDSLQYALSCL